MSAPRANMARYQEGGWGWVVVLASCMAELIVIGNLKAFGVLITAMKDDFDTGLWVIGSINSLHLGVLFIMTPLASVVARKVGGRPVVIFGGFLFGVGVILSSATHDIGYLALTIIAIAGSGGGCTLEIMRAEFALYFHEKYDLAMCISNLGPPLGLLLYGPVTQVLLDTYGWRGAMLILGGFSLHLICAGMLVRRPTGIYAALPCDEDLPNGDQAMKQSEDHTFKKTADRVSIQSENHILDQTRKQLFEKCEDQTPGQSEDQDSGAECKDHNSKQCAQNTDPVMNWCNSFVSTLGLEVFENYDFVLIAAMKMFYSISMGGVWVYMVPNGLAVGLTSHQASFLSTAYGFGSVAGPVLAIFVMKKQLASCQATATIAAAVSAVTLAVDPLIPSFAGQMVNTFLLGVGISAVIQVVCVLTRYLPFSDDKFVIVLGWLGFLGGVATSIGDTLSGLLYDVTQSFCGTFFAYSATMVAVGLLPLLDMCRIRYHNWLKEKQGS